MKSSDGLVKHGIFMFLATSVTNFSNYLFQVFMGRILGPASYGVLISLLSVLLIISVPTAALQTVIAKYVSNFKVRSENAKMSYLLVRSTRKLSLCAVLGFTVFAFASGRVASFLQIPSVTPVIILGTAIPLALIIPIAYGSLQGLQRFGHLGANMIATALGRLIFGVILVYLGLGVNGAVAASTLSLMLSLLLAFMPLRFLYSQTSGNAELNSSEIYRYLWPVLIGLSSVAIITNMDVIMVKHFFGAVEAGYYSGAALAGKVVLFLPAAVAMVMFPKTSELHARKQDSLAILWKSLSLVGAMCGLVTLVYFLFPSFIISLLLGTRYSQSAPLIGLLGLAMTFFALLNVLVLYQLSISSSRFVFPLVTGTLLQGILLSLFHQTLVQIIFVMAGTSSILVLITGWTASRAGKKSFQES
jgi:O-antigen/teichoic acid export membrane protein